MSTVSAVVVGTPVVVVALDVVVAAGTVVVGAIVVVVGEVERVAPSCVVPHADKVRARTTVVGRPCRNSWFEPT